MALSYQHSAPAHRSSDGDDGEDDVDVLFECFETDWEKERHNRGVHRQKLLVVTLLFLGMLALWSSGALNSQEPFVRQGGELFANSVVPPLLGSTHGTSKEADGEKKKRPELSDTPEADWNGEGHYEWQKCKKSNDPNCWKQEKKRVNSYWEDFGLQMKTAWKGFRQCMYAFFEGTDGGE